MLQSRLSLYVSWEIGVKSKRERKKEKFFGCWFAPHFLNGFSANREMKTISTYTLLLAAVSLHQNYSFCTMSSCVLAQNAQLRRATTHVTNKRGRFFTHMGIGFCQMISCKGVSVSSCRSSTSGLKKGKQMRAVFPLF